MQSPNQILFWSSMLFNNLNPNILTLAYACLVGMSIDLNNAEDKPNVLHCNYMLQLTKNKLFCILHTVSHHQVAIQMLLFQLQSHPEINKIYLKFTSTIKNVNSIHFMNFRSWNLNLSDPHQRHVFCGPSSIWLIYYFNLIFIDLWVGLPTFYMKTLIPTYVLDLALILKGTVCVLKLMCSHPYVVQGNHLHAQISKLGSVAISPILCSSSVSLGSGYCLFFLCCIQALQIFKWIWSNEDNKWTCENYSGSG